MGARVLICSSAQSKMANCVRDIIHEGHNIVMVDTWSQELINPLTLSEMDVVIVETSFFGAPIDEVLNRMLKICYKAEIIVLHEEDLEPEYMEGYSVVPGQQFARNYVDVLSHHGMRLGKAIARREAAVGRHIPGLEPPRVLCIDDDESARDILKVILTKGGYQVEETDSARVGLALLRRFAMDGTPFSVIIVDLMMPGMDGFEFLAQMRAGKWAANTPVIVSSSRNDPNAISQVYRYDIAGYVLKPYQPKRLLESVAEAMELGDV